MSISNGNVMDIVSLEQNISFALLRRCRSRSVLKIQSLQGIIQGDPKNIQHTLSDIFGTHFLRVPRYMWLIVTRSDFIQPATFSLSYASFIKTGQEHSRVRTQSDKGCADV